MFGHHFPQGSGKVDEAEQGNEHPSLSLLFPRQTGSSPAHNGGHHQQPIYIKIQKRKKKNSLNCHPTELHNLWSLFFCIKKDDAERIFSASLRATNATLDDLCVSRFASLSDTAAKMLLME